MTEVKQITADAAARNLIPTALDWFIDNFFRLFVPSKREKIEGTKCPVAIPNDFILASL